MNLFEAINAVEASAANLATADQTQAAAQAKYEAALAAKQSADSADVEAAVAFNASLDALINAATAAKREVPAA